MRDLESVCKVAVVQATPVMFQKRKMRGKSAQADGGMRCKWGAAHRIP